MTDGTPYDPYDLARSHYRENLWLRSLLTGVAQELERMAARGQGETGVLLGRAQRVRRVLPSDINHKLTLPLNPFMEGDHENDHWHFGLLPFAPLCGL